MGVPTWRPLRPRISKNPKPKNFDQKRDENGLAMGNGPRNLRNFEEPIQKFQATIPTVHYHLVFSLGGLVELTQNPIFHFDLRVCFKKHLEVAG